MNKVVSGGQDGVDIIALRAAKEMGFETGGWMAYEWRTITGQHPEYGEKYGLKECEIPGYPVRTLRNVLLADATVVIAEHLGIGSGSLLTINRCRENKRPYVFVAWPLSDAMWPDKRQLVATFCQQYETVNFAGSREVDDPERLYSFLIEVMQFVKEGQHVGTESDQAQ